MSGFWSRGRNVDSPWDTWGPSKNLMLRAARLDDVKGNLTVQATRLVGEGGSFIYTFRVSAERQELLEGRASIFLKYLEQQS